MPFIIVTEDGELGEGPWDTREQAEEFLFNEVGVRADVLEVSVGYAKDLRKVRDLAYDISFAAEDEFSQHLPPRTPHPDEPETRAERAGEAGEPLPWTSHSAFVDYFLSFYGPSGPYKDTIPGVTKAEIIDGIKMRG